MHVVNIDLEHGPNCNDELKLNADLAAGRSAPGTGSNGRVDLGERHIEFCPRSRFAQSFQSFAQRIISLAAPEPSERFAASNDELGPRQRFTCAIAFQPVALAFRASPVALLEQRPRWWLQADGSAHETGR